jgi:hypothetical protein
VSQLDLDGKFSCGAQGIVRETIALFMLVAVLAGLRWDGHPLEISGGPEGHADQRGGA